MKYLIFGGNGQLGCALRAHLQGKAEVLCLDKTQLDIVDKHQVMAATCAFLPDVVINAAAYTAVDKAESEADLCFAVNVAGAEHIALAAQQVGAKMLHFSSDYVFDGKANKPYAEDASTAPLNIYGQSKLFSEQAVAQACARHFIVRTSWLFGAIGQGFVHHILQQAKQQQPLRVVADQVGSPTWVMDLARVAIALATSDEASLDYGLYHFSGSGAVSWFDFAQAILAQAHALALLPESAQLSAITSTEYSGIAVRPRYSVLANDYIQAALNLSPCDWRVGLRVVLSSLKGIK